MGEMRLTKNLNRERSDMGERAKWNGIFKSTERGEREREREKGKKIRGMRGRKGGIGREG